MDDQERVRAAALVASTATDVRDSLRRFVAEYHDPRVLRRVYERLDLDCMRHPDDRVLARAEAFVAGALASVEHMTLTR